VFTGNILKQPAFRKIKARTIKGGYPNTDLIMESAMVIGCHHGLSADQLSYMEAKVSEFLVQYSK